jgi:tripartite-type tricarboxylate transporter receptor subunit TctC
VDNRPGGGGTIGAEAAVRAAPDGYTMIIVSAAYAANAALHKLPYDPVSDVTPVALIGEVGNLVVVHPSVPVKSIAELIAQDRANPGARSTTAPAAPAATRTLQPSSSTRWRAPG